VGGDPLTEASLLVGKEGNMRRFGLEIPEIRQKCIFCRNTCILSVDLT